MMTASSKESIAEDTEVRTITIRLPGLVYRQFKAALALDGETVQAVIEACVREYLNNR